MADTKISNLDALATPDDLDVLPIVDVSAAQTKKVTFDDLITTLQSRIIYIGDSAPDPAQVNLWLDTSS